MSKNDKNKEQEDTAREGADNYENEEEVDQERKAEADAEVSDEQQQTSYDSLEREELIEYLQQKDEKIEELQEQLTEAQDKHLRKVAELDNMKKRINREREEIKEQAKINAIEDFLPINDDLQRTLNAAEGLEIDDKFLDGVKMVSDKFENVLRQNGVERIDQTMVPFDVDKHEAMMRQPAEDEDVEPNTVLQILENGYRIGDRTIRHAKVIVSE